MAAAKQERLVRFLQAGGKLLLTPVLPTHDEAGEPCTILRDYLGGGTQCAAPGGPVRLTVADLPNLTHSGPVFLASDLPDTARVVGVDEFSGQPFAWEQTLQGGGAVIVLGWAWSHTVRRQEEMLVRLLASLGLQQKVLCSNSNVWTVLRTAGDRSMLFLMNLFSSPMEATVRCQPSWSSTMLPAATYYLPPMTVHWCELQAGQPNGAETTPHEGERQPTSGK